MATVSPDSVAQYQIKAFIERIERLEEERKAIAGDIAEVYAEAKGNGFDKKALKAVVRIRAVDHSERMEHEALVELYMSALGMVAAPVDEDDDEQPHVHVHTRGEIKSTAASQKRAQTATEVGTGGGNLGPASRSSAQAKTGVPAGVPADQSEAPGDGQSQHNSGVRVAAVDTNSQHGAESAEEEAQVATERAAPSAQPITAPRHDVVEAGEGTTAASSPDTQSEPAVLVEPDAAARGDRSATPAAAPVVAPFVATYPEPGVIVMERCPPEGIVAHPFAACWPVNSIDVTDGVREPIVKQGKFILDGRGRYFAARDAGIEYPVVQYDGTDVLGDIIRWNLASRKLSENQRRLIAQKLAKVEPSRADDVMQLFELHREAAE